MPVTMIVSEDAGETWTNKEVLDHPGVRRSYAGMSGDGSFIYALMCVDKTMGSEATYFLSARTWETHGQPKSRSMIL